MTSPPDAATLHLVSGAKQAKLEIPEEHKKLWDWGAESLFFVSWSLSSGRPLFGGGVLKNIKMGCRPKCWVVQPPPPQKKKKEVP